MKLVIAEKPQLGQLIADAIDGNEKTKDSVIYKGDYCIVWAFGHLLELKQPDEYNPELKKWSLETLPIYFPDWGVRPKKSDGKGMPPATRVKQIAELAKTSECIIHAGDPDDEGQLLIDELIRYIGYKKPVYRLATGDTTIPALKAALKNLHYNEDSEDLGWAAYARSVSDMTFGVNASRYFSIKNTARLTVGRVQTPTLGMVVARDALIEGHKKIIYYSIFADVLIDGKVIRCKYEPMKDDSNLTDGRILNESYAKSRAEMIRDEVFRAKVTEKEGLEYPPLPFDLTELQTYCSKMFGYSPTETMEATQILRDSYNAISYNRSDCRYLSDNHFDEAPDTMNTVIQNIRVKPKGLDMTIRSECFDSSKITAHFAIIPQNTPLDLNKLGVREKNVYLAIVKYYMAQFMPPAKKKKTKVVMNLPDGGTLTATSTAVLEKGYLFLFAKDIASDKKDADADSDDDCSPLSEIVPGSYDGDVQSVSVEQKETKPPARYTQGTLIKDMSRISKYVDDPEVKKLLMAKDKDKKGENGSIGTVATRASIISGLISRGFLKDDGKHVISTPLGRELIRILPDEIKKPNLTAYWWSIQEDIRSGDAGYEALTENVLAMVNEMIHTEYPLIDKSVLPPQSAGGGYRAALGKCPRCGKDVVEGTKGFGCSGFRDGCKFVIWKTSKNPAFAKITFTASDAKDFLAGKSVHKKGLLKKDGKTFEADLIMEDDPTQKYSPSFKFADRKKEAKPFSVSGIQMY